MKNQRLNKRKTFSKNSFRIFEFNDLKSDSKIELCIKRSFELRYRSSILPQLFGVISENQLENLLSFKNSFKTKEKLRMFRKREKLLSWVYCIYKN